jgi:hypothetical protein
VLGHPAAGGKLLEFVRDRREPLRTRAAYALVSLPAEAVEHIWRGLDDDDLDVVRLIALSIVRSVAELEGPYGARRARWFRTDKDYATVYVGEAITVVTEVLRRRADSEDLRVREAVLHALANIQSALRDIRVRGRDTIHYAPHDRVPSRLHLELPEEKAARSTVEMATERARSPRYADVRLIHDEVPGRGDVVEGEALIVGRWYRLELAIRQRPIGIPTAEGRRQPIREPSEPRPVRVMVTAESDGFYIDEPVQTFMLPSQGDATHNALFRVRALAVTRAQSDLPKIRLRLYCHFALMALLTVEADVVGRLDDPKTSRQGPNRLISISEQRLGSNPVELSGVLPRTLNISVSQVGSTMGIRWAFDTGPDRLDFTTPLRVETAELEDAVASVRTLWSEIAMGETFMHGLVGDADRFLVTIRELAMAGRRLWTMLFRRDTTSAIFAVGKWLEEHSPPNDSVMQIAMEDKDIDLVFPWALMYDRPVPPENHRLPDLSGFWGLRYQIEQRPFGSTQIDDHPVPADSLRLAYMLWEQFRNAHQHTQYLESLAARSSGRILLSRPPITEADACMEELGTSESNILYFYTHGHTRTRRMAISDTAGQNLFLQRYEALSADDPRKGNLSFIYDAIRTGHFEVDRSWIELTYGKIYLDSMYEWIEQPLREKALVFLNMCESAQVTPTLTDSFIHFFLNRGAAAVIGTECPMTLEFAHPFANWCLESLMEGSTLGAAILAARRRAIELNNPLGLAYTPFGSSMLRYEPPPLESSTDRN